MIGVGLSNNESIIFFDSDSNLYEFSDNVQPDYNFYILPLCGNRREWGMGIIQKSDCDLLNKIRLQIETT